MTLTKDEIAKARAHKKKQGLTFIKELDILQTMSDLTYYERNKEKVQAYQKEYYEENKERINERIKKWREKNIDQVKAWQKEYDETHREERQAYLKQYRKDNKDKCAAAVAKWNHDNKVKVIAHYSNGTNRCAYCHDDWFPGLTIDHMDGDGAKDNNQHTRLPRLLIKRDLPDGYQILCATCNLVKKNMTDRQFRKKYPERIK